ncbi:hypothetical protein [Sneathiella glossodoripedis]|uniref:hypothetical protein n=1 Tax=Sneathiella glossodoripedis TaxID=418853 RepID=UPI000472CBB7|nr:hypothetical protein [Sneathiella glossodoripedis]
MSSKITFLRSVLVLLALSVVNGCARSAPDLPPSFSEANKHEIEKEIGVSEEQKRLTCEQIKSRQDEILIRYTENEAVIKSNRAHNQVVGYFGAVLFLPLLVAADHDQEAKTELDNLQKEKDQLNYLVKVKNCAIKEQSASSS